MWEAMLEFEVYDAEAGPKVPGAVTMLIELRKAFGKVPLTAAWNWRLCGYFAHQRRAFFFEGSAAALVQAYTAIFLGSRVNVVLLQLGVQDAMSKVFKAWPGVRIKMYVDDNKNHMCKAYTGARSNNSGKERV